MENARHRDLNSDIPVYLLVLVQPSRVDWMCFDFPFNEFKVFRGTPFDSFQIDMLGSFCLLLILRRSNTSRLNQSFCLAVLDHCLAFVASSYDMTALLAIIFSVLVA